MNLVPHRKSAQAGLADKPILGGFGGRIVFPSDPSMQKNTYLRAQSIYMGPALGCLDPHGSTCIQHIRRAWSTYRIVAEHGISLVNGMEYLEQVWNRWFPEYWKNMERLGICGK